MFLLDIQLCNHLDAPVKCSDIFPDYFERAKLTAWGNRKLAQDENHELDPWAAAELYDATDKREWGNVFICCMG